VFITVALRAEGEHAGRVREIDDFYDTVVAGNRYPGAVGRESETSCREVRAEEEALGGIGEGAEDADGTVFTAGDDFVVLWRCVLAEGARKMR